MVLVVVVVAVTVIASVMIMMVIMSGHGGCSPAFFHGSPGSVPGQSMWDLRWPECH